MTRAHTPECGCTAELRPAAGARRDHLRTTPGIFGFLTRARFFIDRSCRVRGSTAPRFGCLVRVPATAALAAKTCPPDRQVPFLLQAMAPPSGFSACNGHALAPAQTVARPARCSGPKGIWAPGEGHPMEAHPTAIRVVAERRPGTREDEGKSRPCLVGTATWYRPARRACAGAEAALGSGPARRPSQQSSPTPAVAYHADPTS